MRLLHLCYPKNYKLPPGYFPFKSKPPSSQTPLLFWQMCSSAWFAKDVPYELTAYSKETVMGWIVSSKFIGWCPNPSTMDLIWRWRLFSCPALLRYNWPITVCQFKVYNILIKYTYILQYDYQCNLVISTLRNF